MENDQKELKKLLDIQDMEDEDYRAFAVICRLLMLFLYYWLYLAIFEEFGNCRCQ